jgi:pyruvate dehydrogenase E2 component (dihydrolipoamide acetyltransferase)
VDALSALRSQLNATLAAGASGGKLSLNDFVVKAAALAMRKVPEANASWHGDFIRRYHSADAGVAVQTEGGLLVPVVRGADAKGLAQIAAEVKELAGKVRLRSQGRGRWAWAAVQF